MKTLYEIIKSLQAAQGTLAKQAIMDANKDNELFKAYMKATYDVGINYYQKKIRTGEYFAPGMCWFNEELIAEIVDNLSNRKKTGEAAKDWLGMIYDYMYKEDQELLTYIINRSIGAGVGDTMVLKTWPDLYFIPPYMRAASMDEKVRERFSKFDFFIVELKHDGAFSYLRKHGESSQAITRQGTIYPAWFSDKLSEGLAPGWTLMGEMEVYKDGQLLSRKEGNGILNSVAKGADESEFDEYYFCYTTWDCVRDLEFYAGKSEDWLTTRKRNLNSLVIGCGNQIRTIHYETVDNVAQAKVIHTKITSQGKEGTVWKAPDGIWRDCSSGSKDMVKVKIVFEADFEITHTYEGTGKAKGMLGGIGIKTSCGKLVNNLGSGFTDDQRKALWAIRDTLPGMICTAEANDVISNRDKDTVSLSLGIFIELRYDKTEADSLERVYEQLESAKMGKQMGDE